MSYPRAVVPLGALLSACLVAAVYAQVPVCDTQALASNPATSDSLYPSTSAEVQIPSSGARLHGVLYLAQGKGPHTTVLVLHGFLATAMMNADLAQAVRRTLARDIGEGSCPGAGRPQRGMAFGAVRAHPGEEASAARRGDTRYHRAIRRGV